MNNIMKTFKFLMPFLLVTFTLVGCDTDDLRNDIDELKNRVESLEAQVSAFNDNINALKALTDKKLTIQEVKEENGVYTLLLSNEQTITLKQGEDFSAPQEPEVTITNGTWWINGTDTGCDVSDVVPEFRIENSYWQVKLNGNWQNVKDANGNDVQAVADGTQTGGNSFFESVNYDETAGVLNIVLKEGSQPLKLPVIQDLKCAIDKSSLTNGTLVVGYGDVAKLKVSIKGDNAFVTAPSGWVVTLSEPDTSGEAMLTVEAPASAPVLASALAMTRATADNSKDLTVQVNKGVNWAVDKIQVEAEEVIESYFALYSSGKTFEIAGHKINNTLYPDAKLVDRNEFEFTTDNPLYFIDSSVDVNWTSTANFPNLILIGNSSNVKSKITPTKQIKILNENADGLFLVHNVEIDAQNVMNAEGNSTTYLLTQNGNSSFGKVMFDNVKLIAMSGQPITFISRNDRSISELIIQNSLIELSAGTQQQYIISLSSSTATYPNINLTNNIFYSKDNKQLLTNFRLFRGVNAKITNFKLHNNSFINIACSTEFYVYAKEITNIDVTKNIFFTDNTLPGNCGLIRATTTIPTGTVCTDNIVYKISTNSWLAFFGSKGFEGYEEFKIITDNPFEGGQFEPSTGTFVPNSTYSGYGATIK